MHFSLEERISETGEGDFCGEGDSLGRGGAFFFKEGISDEGEGDFLRRKFMKEEKVIFLRRQNFIDANF